MNTQLIKAFFCPKQNMKFLRLYLLRKVTATHKFNEWFLLDRKYEEMYTWYSGALMFWYNKPLKNGMMTTKTESFKSFEYYVLLLKRRIKCLIEKVI